MENHENKCFLLLFYYNTSTKGRNASTPLYAQLQIGVRFSPTVFVGTVQCQEAGTQADRGLPQPSHSSFYPTALN